jgi:hypothetical protein
MKRTLAVWAIFLSIAAAYAGDKDKDKRFHAGPAESYPNRQTQAKVTVAAEPYVTEDQIKAAFDKQNPLKYGILPVLVVIHNGSDKALQLDLKAEYVNAEGRHANAIPPQDVPLIVSHKQPTGVPIQVNPLPFPHGHKKGPLSGWEIPGRAFSVKLLPAGDSASGFFYFDVGLQPGSSLYLDGLSQADGHPLIYYEVPLDTNTR